MVISQAAAGIERQKMPRRAIVRPMSNMVSTREDGVENGRKSSVIVRVQENRVSKSGIRMLLGYDAECGRSNTVWRDE